MKTPHLYTIGLTGGIACGKSTVLARLEQLGARVLDADRVVHELQQPGTPVYAAIVDAFGPEVLAEPGGPLDRRRLGALVFNDATALRRLEGIVHPAVRAFIRGWLEEQAGVAAAAGATQVVVIDAIRLIEGGYPALCDAVWVVTCTEEQQVARLIQTRGMSVEEARARIAAQPPQASRLPHADVVIDNSGSLEDALAQVDAAWARVG